MQLIIATSQFAVCSDIESNKMNIINQMHIAQGSGCDIIHFPEGSLSGYAGVDMSSFENFNWDYLKACTQEIMNQANALDLWVLLGSSHQLSGNNKPHQ